MSLLDELTSPQSGQCSACGRACWGTTPLGTLCGMSQPDFTRCAGRFVGKVAVSVMTRGTVDPDTGIITETNDPPVATVVPRSMIDAFDHETLPAGAINLLPLFDLVWFLWLRRYKEDGWHSTEIDIEASKSFARAVFESVHVPPGVVVVVAETPICAVLVNGKHRPEVLSIIVRTARPALISSADRVNETVRYIEHMMEGTRAFAFYTPPLIQVPEDGKGSCWIRCGGAR